MNLINEISNLYNSISELGDLVKYSGIIFFISLMYFIYLIIDYIPTEFIRKFVFLLVASIIITSSI